MAYTSKKRAVFLDAVQNLMCTSKKRGLFLEAGSQIEVHLRHFCRVFVGGGHKASRVRLQTKLARLILSGRPWFWPTTVPTMEDCAPVMESYMQNSIGRCRQIRRPTTCWFGRTIAGQKQDRRLKGADANKTQRVRADSFVRLLSICCRRCYLEFYFCFCKT